MKQRVCVFAALTYIALAFSGCGSQASGISFTAPAGWKATPGMFGRFQMWITGSGQQDHQIVILVRGDQNMRLEDSQNMSGTHRMRDFKRSAITLCGSERAEQSSVRAKAAPDPSRSKKLCKA